MMNYNYDYYPKLLEALGFEKEVDFVSCYLPADAFKIPERVERIAQRVIGTWRSLGEEIQDEAGIGPVGAPHWLCLQQGLYSQLGVLPLYRRRCAVCSE